MKTANSNWYTNHCLPKVFEEWCERRPRHGTQGSLLHHDIARAHTAAATLDFLAESSVNLVTRAP